MNGARSIMKPGRREEASSPAVISTRDIDSRRREGGWPESGTAGQVPDDEILPGRLSSHPRTADKSPDLGGKRLGEERRGKGRGTSWKSSRHPSTVYTVGLHGYGGGVGSGGTHAATYTDGNGKRRRTSNTSTEDALDS